ncbi:MAG: CotH kinase family protein, partial [Clostridia bacterium]|nr:CotH kinase family protein [Clostridia bacterium]
MKKAILFLCIAALLLPLICMVYCGTPSSKVSQSDDPSSSVDKEEEGDKDTEQAGSETAPSGSAEAEEQPPSGGESEESVKNDSGLPPYNGAAFEESTPVIYIKTENGASISTNKQEVNCTISLRCNEYDLCADDLPATIRTRGNGSLGAASSIGKLPYKIKFQNKINIFMLGDGKAKDWVLLDHVGEQSMLRNYAARLLGDMLDGIPYSTNSRLVNVYLNGKYVGVYELAEQVEVGKDRINVDDSRSEAENGFLVELDA